MRTPIRRALRALAAATGAVAITVAIAAPSIAAAPEESDLVSPAQPLLIESVHAAG